MKPYFQEDGITIYHGDCREVFSELRGDLLVADPPYGETSLEWDACAKNWMMAAGVAVGFPASLWCFGSMRFFLREYWRVFGMAILSGFDLAKTERLGLCGREIQSRA